MNLRCLPMPKKRVIERRQKMIVVMEQFTPHIEFPFPCFAWDIGFCDGVSDLYEDGVPENHFAFCEQLTTRKLGN